MVLFHPLSPSQQYQLLARAWSKRMWLLLGTHKIIMTLFLPCWCPLPREGRMFLACSKDPAASRPLCKGCVGLLRDSVLWALALGSSFFVSLMRPSLPLPMA